MLNGQNLEPVAMADIFAARQRLGRLLSPTPLVSLEPLNLQLGHRVHLKAESLQPTGAYKLRGAFNKTSYLLETLDKPVKIITASSGNHGMACAYSARQLGIQAVVVVPETTPAVKKDCIRAFGAAIVEYGQTYDDSFAEACRLIEKEACYYVHPVADRQVLGGQGTISLEIMEQLPSVDTIVVPVGGGGLISGISYTIKQLKPSVRVVGVMPEGSAVYAKSRQAGRLVELETAASVADAVVRRTGEEYLFPYIEEHVADLVTVSEESILRGVRLAQMYGKLTLEGSGALPLAAVLEGKVTPTEGTVLICSGSNIDGSLLQRAMES